MRTVRKHPTAVALGAGIVLGALASNLLDTGAALLVGAWVGALAERALRGHRKSVQGTAGRPATGDPREARADELHALRVARSRAQLRDQLIRLKVRRSSWASSARAQRAREEAAYNRGVEEALAAWPRRQQD